MVDIETLTATEFQEMPLVTEGESKEVRYAGEGQVVIRLKPTIYSYTHNRTGIIEGSDTARLEVIQQLLPVITNAGLEHTYRQVNDAWILSDLVLRPELEGHGPVFRPDDLTSAEILELPKAPPIEVVAKARHTGTSKHRYYNFGAYPTRDGQHIKPEDAYPEPIVRFDWRNPMHHPVTGERLADEILPEAVADWFIDTHEATQIGARAFEVLSEFFRSKTLDLWDICFFITEDGKKLFGEISPDCMRVRALGDVALDKDVWRAGGSSDEVLEKWQTMATMLATNKEGILQT